MLGHVEIVHLNFGELLHTLLRLGLCVGDPFFLLGGVDGFALQLHGVALALKHVLPDGAAETTLLGDLLLIVILVRGPLLLAYACILPTKHMIITV